ncbi:EmrB/QacA subfamily drug resistance transporter [Stella humosa]|uniref:EmrB/QacA subfamily drug resistance transporter n=1 Tax=Stella humosa TaxID=94 RepID=A0A3N1MB30_9PROT|nr:MDR family MFS transporter [Stella humosa]ROP99969.1 EmrB/QacA subfamily drug resistance transporter [Stella humosa]BBK30800.1 MFS transporter [Stella humosa]
MPPSHPAGDPPPKTHREIRSTIFGLMMAMMLAALDQTIVATAMPTIGRDLGDFQNLPWVITAYLIAATAVVPLYGRLADTHGRHITMLSAIVIFVAGSVASAMAPSVAALAVARAIQGLGGGGLVALAQTIIADVVPPKERGRYQVYIASVFAASGVAGPVLGGLIAQHLHWSVIFWLNIPCGAAALFMTNSVLKKMPRVHRRRRMDFAGAGLMVAATTTLLLALNWGGVRMPWSSPVIMALLVTSAMIWLLFIARIRTADEPLIPSELLRNSVVMLGITSAGFGMGTFMGLTFFVPIYLELVVGLSASQSGLALIPLLVGTVTGAITSGNVMARVRHYKRLPMVGLAISTSALATLALFPQGLPLWGLEILFAVASFGVGTSFPVTTVCIQNAVQMHMMGSATATMHFFRQLSGALVIAGFGAIVLGSGVVAGRGAGTVLSAANSATLVASFQWVFLAAAMGVSTALCAFVMMRELPLRDRVSTAPVTAPAAGD